MIPKRYDDLFIWESPLLPPPLPPRISCFEIRTLPSFSIIQRQLATSVSSNICLLTCSFHFGTVVAFSLLSAPILLSTLSPFRFTDGNPCPFPFSLCRPTSKRQRTAPFKLEKAIPLDLFPHTKLCELVMLFTRDVAALEADKYYKWFY